MSNVDLPFPTDLTMAPAATILCWRRLTCRLEILGSGGFRGGNSGREGVGDRGSGAAATETEGVSARWIYVGGSQWNQRGSDDGGEKSGGGGGGTSQTPKWIALNFIVRFNTF